ncbi:hypothetical protein ACA910_001279 [Epithemia clementina (nom. ined.)]
MEGGNASSTTTASTSTTDAERKRKDPPPSSPCQDTAVATADSEGSQNHNNDDTKSNAEHRPPSQSQPKIKNKKNLSLQPLTIEGERPQKKFYRQRAHCNPLSHNDSFSYPPHPGAMDWTLDHYPHYYSGRKTTIQPTILDVGCGFGGLTMALGRLYPSHPLVENTSDITTTNTTSTSTTTTTFILGLEIRAKVTEYVRLRILAARRAASSSPSSSSSSSSHHNVSVLRTNAQKFLPHFVRPHSLRKLFFCFPDPHFKRKNHARRILSERLLTEYAYLLKRRRQRRPPRLYDAHASNDDDNHYHYEDEDEEDGKLYAITDVWELHLWHVQKCQAHPLLECVAISNGDRETNEANAAQAAAAERDDPCIRAMLTETEEGQKVQRNQGSKYYIVFRRISLEEEEEQEEQWHADNFFPFQTDLQQPQRRREQQQHETPQPQKQEE